MVMVMVVMMVVVVVVMVMMVMIEMVVVMMVMTTTTTTMPVVIVVLVIVVTIMTVTTIKTLNDVLRNSCLPQCAKANLRIPSSGSPIWSARGNELRMKPTPRPSTPAHEKPDTRKSLGWRRPQITPHPPPLRPEWTAAAAGRLATLSAPPRVSGGWRLSCRVESEGVISRVS